MSRHDRRRDAPAHARPDFVSSVQLATFVAHGSRVAARAAAPTRRQGRSSGGPAHPGQNRAIREWALAKGYEIAPRGRIKQEIVEAFHEMAGR